LLLEVVLAPRRFRVDGKALHRGARHCR
jgi:hypothetical protein